MALLRRSPNPQLLTTVPQEVFDLLTVEMHLWETAPCRRAAPLPLGRYRHTHIETLCSWICSWRMAVLDRTSNEM